jgi:hypothetical protein
VVACAQYAVSLVVQLNGGRGGGGGGGGLLQQKLLTISEVCIGMETTSFEIQPPDHMEKSLLDEGKG